MDGHGSMPFCLVEQSALGQLAFLVAIEVEAAGEAAVVVALGPQGEERHQGKSTHGKGCGDDPFHAGDVAGGAGLVILPSLSPTRLIL